MLRYADFRELKNSLGTTSGDPGALDPGVVGLDESKALSILSNIDEVRRGEDGTDDGATELPV